MRYVKRDVNIYEFRQSLINEICHNNFMLEEYKKSVISQQKINSFFQKIYFFLNKNYNPIRKQNDSRRRSTQH